MKVDRGEGPRLEHHARGTRGMCECWCSGRSKLTDWSGFTLQYVSLRNGTLSLEIVCQPGRMVQRDFMMGRARMNIWLCPSTHER